MDTECCQEETVFIRQREGERERDWDKKTDHPVPVPGHFFSLSLSLSSTPRNNSPNEEDIGTRRFSITGQQQRATGGEGGGLEGSSITAAARGMEKSDANTERRVYSCIRKWVYFVSPLKLTNHLEKLHGRKIQHSF